MERVPCWEQYNRESGPSAHCTVVVEHVVVQVRRVHLREDVVAVRPELRGCLEVVRGGHDHLRAAETVQSDGASTAFSVQSDAPLALLGRA